MLDADCQTVGAPAPKVSVGMPVYNASEHLAEALDSLLEQTYVDFEVVICDNASTDDTVEIVQAYAERDLRIRLLRNERNLGAADNFNRVFSECKGRYFKWFAHDDRIAPTYLECCVNVLDAEGPEVVLVFPQRVEMFREGEMRGPDNRVRWNEAAPPYDRISFARSMLIPDRRFPTLVFGLMRSEVLRKTGLIGAFHCADLVLLTELRMLGSFRHLPEPLFCNRLHERRSKAEEAAWYDPANADRLSRPARRLLRERLRGVWRSETGPFRKLWCSLCVVVLGQLVSRTPSWLSDRFKMMASLIYRAWDRLTLSAVSHCRRSYWAHRAWMLLAGLRRLDVGKLRIALGSSSPQSREALCTFVATKFARRRCAGARDLLATWRDGPCPDRRAAALDVLDQDAHVPPAESVGAATISNV